MLSNVEIIGELQRMSKLDEAVERAQCGNQRYLILNPNYP